MNAGTGTNHLSGTAAPGVPAFSGAFAAESAPDADALAKVLSNPVAALISVPLQLNYDEGYGTGTVA
ncbi:MAG TPA: hypothetical protein VIZ63_09040 [Povalibacter sp.]